MKRHQISMDLALPHDARDCEACVERLTNELRQQPHVLDAHVDLSNENAPNLCVHYDAAAISIQKIESLVARSGAELTSRFEHLTGTVEGLRHERQRGAIEAALLAVPGILHVALGFGSRRLMIEFDPQVTTRREVVKEVKRAGLSILDGQPEPLGDVDADEHGEKHHHHGGLFGERSELVFSLACGGLTAGDGRLRSWMSPRLFPRARSSWPTLWVPGSPCRK